MAQTPLLCDELDIRVLLKRFRSWWPNPLKRGLAIYCKQVELQFWTIDYILRGSLGFKNHDACGVWRLSLFRTNIRFTDTHRRTKTQVLQDYTVYQMSPEGKSERWVYRRYYRLICICKPQRGSCRRPLSGQHFHKTNPSVFGLSQNPCSCKQNRACLLLVEEAPNQNVRFLTVSDNFDYHRLNKFDSRQIIDGLKVIEAITQGTQGLVKLCSKLRSQCLRSPEIVIKGARLIIGAAS